MSGETARRIIVAVLQNIDNWEERVAEIERHAIPGNKLRALSLLRDMYQAKLSLRRLSGIDD